MITINNFGEERKQIDFKLQLKALKIAKGLHKETNLCLETCLSVGLADAKIDKEALEPLEYFYSFYNRDNMEEFACNPCILGFDDRYHEQLFLDFMIEQTQIEVDKITEKSNDKKTDK